MPLSKHYGGHGAKVMKNMKKEYGEEKGKKVFYATENKRKGMDTAPSSSVKRKHGVK
jgi:hypothetical protein